MSLACVSSFMLATITLVTLFSPHNYTILSLFYHVSGSSDISVVSHLVWAYFHVLCKAFDPHNL